ncbi:MAG: acyl-CoA dehydrogenase family protein [Candidatus Binatia bacterium]
MDKGFFSRDIELFIDRRVDWQRYLRYRRSGAGVAEELDTYKMVLRTLGDICEAIETESDGRWHEEVRLEDGEVVVPPHIASGYRKLAEAGLVCLPLDGEYGGHGLPLVLNVAYLEMIARANASLMTIVGLQTGVAYDIQKYGSEEIRRRYLPHFVSGELQGSMDLTEPQAGSDLGNIRARVTEENGRFFVDGEKIFITNGGAPIHLVLARDGATYDETRGTTNGLSLVLCPRTLPDGSRNGVRIARTESKLGIHGSPTCVVEFEHAEGWVLGRRGEGFRAMLDLMNAARLGVAAQGIGIAEAAYRQAHAYAEERVQFGAPIIRQPLVKSMLTLMAINIQAARALLYRTAALIDMTEAIRDHLASDAGGADPERTALEHQLEQNTQLVRFLTPLCKYYATEISNDVTRHGIQVHGGIGYMAETKAGQYHSDSIITTIYEGTSEIQASFALKEMSKGTLFTALGKIREELESLHGQFPELVALVKDGIGWIEKSLPSLMGDPQYALLNAKRLCDMVIDVLIAAELLLQASASEEKRVLATTFINRHMLAVEMNARRIASGDATRIDRYDRILGLG